MQGEIEIDESYFFALFHSQLQAEGVMPNIRLAKFKGISKNNFILHLKETEFR